MGKDKKKKGGKGKGDGPVLTTFKTLGNTKLVSEVVAAALVATAAALKDSDKARRFAAEAGDQLEKLSKESAERGGAMWKLALDVGRRALETMSGEKPAKAGKPKPKTTKTAAAAKPKAATKRKAAAKSATKSKPAAAKTKTRTKRAPRKA